MERTVEERLVPLEIWQVETQRFLDNLPMAFEQIEQRFRAIEDRLAALEKAKAP